MGCSPWAKHGQAFIKSANISQPPGENTSQGFSWLSGTWTPERRLVLLFFGDLDAPKKMVKGDAGQLDMLLCRPLWSSVGYVRSFIPAFDVVVLLGSLGSGQVFWCKLSFWLFVHEVGNWLVHTCSQSQKKQPTFITSNLLINLLSSASPSFYPWVAGCFFLLIFWGETWWIRIPHPRFGAFGAGVFWRTLPHWDPLVMLRSWAIHPPQEDQKMASSSIERCMDWAQRTERWKKPTATGYNWIYSIYITGYNWIYSVYIYI